MVLDTLAAAVAAWYCGRSGIVLLWSPQGMGEAIKYG